ncbi:MAG: glycosyltransferase family 4 protein [Candidatus Doudnabacteria bacterium]|nr:glycosyltransferase family 4 protein [Candidatus Doudnabacteria bacterium]
MRIGIDIRALMEGRTTGVQVYILNLLAELFKIDPKNHYVLFANSFRRTGLPKFDALNIEVKITRYPNKIFNFLQRFFGWPRIDKLIGPIDLFFSPHWRALAIDKNTPLVVTFHDLSFETVPEFYTLWKRVWHWLMGYRQVARHADRIIAVSENTKKDLVDLYQIPDSKIKVIYPGSPVIATPHLMRGKQSREIAAPLGGLEARNDNDRYFLYFGTFEPRKNLGVLLMAYEQYHKISQKKRRLVLAGSRGWKTRLEIPQPIVSQILIRQNVSEAEKISLYQNAYCFIFPSFYEGFGFPILEAASAGAPVIASFATSVAEIGHDFAVLVNPFRPQQLARAMLELETNPEYYNHLKTRGLATAGEFTWAKTAHKVLELFTQYAYRH